MGIFAVIWTILLFGAGKVNGIKNVFNTNVDCYPSFKNKPNVTEMQCLAQGCHWDPLQPIPCTFVKRILNSTNQCEKFTLASRIPCRNPLYHTMDEATCNQLGCCYSATPPGPGIPRCYQAQGNGYRLDNLKETHYGYEGDLIMLKSLSFNQGPFGNDIQKLKLQVLMETSDRLRIKITDPSFPRYEVKEVLVQEKDKKDSFFSSLSSSSSSLSSSSSSLSSSSSSSTDDNDDDSKDFRSLKKKKKDYKVHFTKIPFGIAVTRISNGEVLFNSTPPLQKSSDIPFGGLIYENQYLEISTSMEAKASVYGLGEQVSPLQLERDGEMGHHYTFFARDEVASHSYHSSYGGENIYGVHPFYLMLSPSGETHGVYLLNSNAMEIVMQKESITYRIVGGILDFFVFTGNSPDQVVQQYTALVGRPQLPPYWALGYHLCKWGYGSLNQTREIVEKMRTMQIPQDVQWNDIDYMDAFLDFTLDPIRFNPLQMKTFIQDLHDHGQRYVSIVDPGISSEYPNYYTTYDEGKTMDVYIKDGKNKDFVGKVWPGLVVYPDFTHPNSTIFWTQQLQKMYSMLSYDGLWIDMNEPSNFCDGACHFMEHQPYRLSSDTQPPFDPFRQPFVPGQIQHTVGGKGDLDSNTIAMSAMQYESLHYNVHSLYGHLEMKATLKALEQIRPGKRSLLVSRSTFSGSGRYGAHWLGDNNSSWSNMKWSISGILNMNMFGIPLVGADICGFIGNTTRELCIRWHQLGAFYPFARNHNDIGGSPQAPVDFDDQAVQLIRHILLERYRLLPYFYTLFFHATTNGKTVARPLWFEFTQDPRVLDLDTQFFLGKGLMVSPVLEEGSLQRSIYFPNASWYDYWTGEPLHLKNKFPCTLNIQAPLSHIPVHLRGGTILPLQNPGLTTEAARKNPFTLMIALHHETQEAKGDLFLDDGESLNSIPMKNYTHLQFHAKINAHGQLVIQSKILVGPTIPKKSGDDHHHPGVGADGHGAGAGFYQITSALQEIKVYGMKSQMDMDSSIFVMDDPTSHYSDDHDSFLKMSRRIPFTYKKEFQLLVCKNFSISLNKEFSISQQSSNSVMSFKKIVG